MSGSSPSRWRRRRLKFSSNINRSSLPETTDEDYEFDYVDISRVSQGRISDEPQMTTFGSAPSRARRLAKPGDTIVSTVRTYLRAVAAVIPSEEPRVFSTGFAVIEPDTRQVHPRFLTYYLQSAQFVERVMAESVGVSYPAINASDIAAYDFWAPPTEEQRAIADFLDRETAQIDAMIEAQQGVVRALRERHEAGWARSYVRLTDNTPVRQVRNCVTSLVDGPFGSSLTSSHYTDEGTRVIRLGNIGVNAFKPQDAAFIDDEYAATLAEHAAEAGDVVMAGLGDSNQPLGRACVVPETLGPAIVKADCYRLRPRDGVYARYLAWALSSPPVLAQNSELARGITRQRMNTALAKSVRVAIPPMEAQVAVVERHDSETERLATAIDAALVVTELLHERREALITAAVTGRIDTETGIERIVSATEKEAS